MNFLRKLREINVDRCIHAFKHPLRSWSVLEWAGAAAGECGEMANVAKKLHRIETLSYDLVAQLQKDDADDLNRALADEVADTIIYLDLLCARQGIDLEQAIRDKFNATSTKVGCEQRL